MVWLVWGEGMYTAFGCVAAGATGIGAWFGKSMAELALSSLLGQGQLVALQYKHHGEPVDVFSRGRLSEEQGEAMSWSRAFWSNTGGDFWCRHRVCSPLQQPPCTCAAHGSPAQRLGEPLEGWAKVERWGMSNLS
jgi:hypothetical protein